MALTLSAQPALAGWCEDNGYPEGCFNLLNTKCISGDPYECNKIHWNRWCYERSDTCEANEYCDDPTGPEPAQCLPECTVSVIETDCSGDSRREKKQFSDCSTEWQTVENCGSDSYGPWTGHCDGNQAYESQTIRQRGCSNGACYDRSGTGERNRRTCAADEKCSNGNCQEQTCQQLNYPKGGCGGFPYDDKSDRECFDNGLYECIDVGNKSCWRKKDDCSAGICKDPTWSAAHCESCADHEGTVGPCSPENAKQCVPDNPDGDPRVCEKKEQQGNYKLLCWVPGGCGGDEKCVAGVCEKKTCEDMGYVSSIPGESCNTLFAGNTACSGSTAYNCDHVTGNPVTGKYCWVAQESCNGGRCIDPPDPVQGAACYYCSDYADTDGMCLQEKGGKCVPDDPSGNPWKCEDKIVSGSFLCWTQQPSCDQATEKCSDGTCQAKTCEEREHLQGACDPYDLDNPDGECIGNAAFRCEDVGGQHCWVEREDCAGGTCADPTGWQDPARCYYCRDYVSTDEMCQVEDEDAVECRAGSPWECKDQLTPLGLDFNAKLLCWSQKDTCEPTEECDPQEGTCHLSCEKMGYPKGSCSGVDPTNCLDGPAGDAYECVSAGGGHCWAMKEECRPNNICTDPLGPALGAHCEPKVPEWESRLQILFPGRSDDLLWFIHITDLHLGIYPDAAEASRLFSLKGDVFSSVAPSFVVATGDLTNSLGIFTFFISGATCCGWQSAIEWNAYNKIVAQDSTFAPLYYDLPGNHDRYGDETWGGETGRDGYKYSSVTESIHKAHDVGSQMTSVGQIAWTRGENLFVGLNTCEETGYTIKHWFARGLGSDCPELSSKELDELEAVVSSWRDAERGPILTFAHHSLFTKGFRDGIVRRGPGLWDVICDGISWDRRGAISYAEILNAYQVTAHIFGHTHDSTVFRRDLELTSGIAWPVSAIHVNTGALKDGVYRVLAIDNGGLAFGREQKLGEWPVVVITSPVTRELDDGDVNPYSYPLPTTCANCKVRALVGAPVYMLGTLSVQYAIDGTVAGSMHSVDKDRRVWEANVPEALLQLASGTTHMLAVETSIDGGVQWQEGDAIAFEVADPLYAPEWVPGTPCHRDSFDIQVHGFQEGTYVRAAWDGEEWVESAKKITNGTASFHWAVPDEASGEEAHYIRVFDEQGNYAVYYVDVCPGFPATPSDLEAVALETGEVELRWTDNSDDEDGFHIYCSEDGGPEAQVASVPANQLGWINESTTAGSRYCCRVRAWNVMGESQPSNVSCATAYEDSDHDGVPDDRDNCANLPNGGQEDTDLDAIGDDCDPCTDADHDCYGRTGFDLSGCCGPTTDCDDNNDQRSPGLTEVCGDSIDNDCDGVVDNCAPTPTPSYTPTPTPTDTPVPTPTDTPTTVTPTPEPCPANVNGGGPIENFELLDFIDLWKAALPPFTGDSGDNFKLLQMIDFWAAPCANGGTGCCCADPQSSPLPYRPGSCEIEAGLKSRGEVRAPAARRLADREG